MDLAKLFKDHVPVVAQQENDEGSARPCISGRRFDDSAGS